MALLEVGTPAPLFKAQNLTGPEFQLEQHVGKKPVILIFPPDQINPAQTNQVGGVYERNRKDVEFVVLIRQNLPLAMLKMAVQQLGIKFPVIHDPQQAIYKMYGVEKPVVVYGIDTRGYIASALEFEPKALNVQLIEEAIAKAKMQQRSV